MIASWEEWLWGLDELLSKLKAMGSGEADGEAMGNPKEYAEKVRESVIRVRTGAAERIQQVANILIITELPIDKVTAAHIARGYAEHEVSERRAQLMEAAGKAAQRRFGLLELALVQECQRDVDNALDSRRHKAIEELIEALLEPPGPFDGGGPTVIVCHRHGARLPVDSDKGDPSFQFLSRASSATSSRWGAGSSHVSHSPGAQSPRSIASVSSCIPSLAGGGSAVASPSARRPMSARGAPPSLPRTVARDDKWGTGIYTHSNQLLTHSTIKTKRAHPPPPSRGEDYLVDDEESLTLMQRAALVAERMGRGGGRLAVLGVAAEMIAEMSSTREEGAKCEGKWRDRRGKAEELVDRKEAEHEKERALLASLKARVDKAEEESFSIKKRAQSSAKTAVLALARLHVLEKEAEAGLKAKRDAAAGRWRQFQRRISMKLLLGNATKYLVNKNNPEELKGMQKATSAEGKKEPVSLKGLIMENDELSLKLASASEMKAEVAAVHTSLAAFGEALKTMAEAVNTAAKKGGGVSSVMEETGDAVLDMQNKVRDLHKKLERKVVPDSGFAEHISHRLSAEMARSKVGVQSVKNLQREVEEAAKEKHVLRTKVLRLEKLLAEETSARGREEEKAQVLQGEIDRLTREAHRVAAQPKGLMGSALDDALRSHTERVTAVEAALAEERDKYEELMERLACNEMERRDMQGAFMMVFDHLREAGGSSEEAVQNWIRRFSGRAWFARAQVQAREAYDERQGAIDLLAKVQMETPGKRAGSVSFATPRRGATPL